LRRPTRDETKTVDLPLELLVVVALDRLDAVAVVLKRLVVRRVILGLNHGAL
jgi:hypothetical protein